MDVSSKVTDKALVLGPETGTLIGCVRPYLDKAILLSWAAKKLNATNFPSM